MTTKKIYISIIAAVIILAGILATALIIFSEQIFGGNKNIAISSPSLQSKSQSQRSAFYFPRFFNPNDKVFDNLNPNLSTSNINSTSSRSLPSLLDISLSPIQKEKMQKIVYKSETCPDKTNTTHGLTELKFGENAESSLLIAQKTMVLDKFDSANFERAVNFLARNTDFMADTNSTFGPDYLQFLRRGCAISNIQKIKEYRGDQFKNVNNTENNRMLTDIRGLDSNLFINLNIYGKKDDNIFLISKSYPYADLLSRDEKDSCTTNGAPVRTCIKKIIETKSSLDEKFTNDAKKLAIDYGF